MHSSSATNQSQADSPDASSSPANASPANASGAETMPSAVQILPEAAQTLQGDNFSALLLDRWQSLEQATFNLITRNFKVQGKLFLKELLGLTGAEISLNVMPPGGAVPFYHKHQQSEEIYLFIQGQGEFQVDGECFAVQAGSVVRVAPDGERCWRNTGADMLVAIVVQVLQKSYESIHTIVDGVAIDKPVVWTD
ncbi:cupin domain-containing protein [Alkalinema pantanalense CENA528]|uniref:cupin domain-containing protein n=1 Tax=Alkalinema pantanalense TaxID=1620705 RepID=UPI003D6E0938